ncbi:MAG: lipid-A-disaccharide synthase [Verrucomicrobiota bacterium]
MKKLYFVAGEMSGDAHGSAVMKAIWGEVGGEVAFRGVGGEKMASVDGAEGLRDWLDEAAVLGLWEVLKKYGYFRKEFARVLGEIDECAPDAVVLIDYPGFNLRLAKALQARRPGTKIIYYISPQVWAWNRGRIGKMARMLDLMICIFPFEKELYESSGLRTEFVGHPMADALERGRFEREAELVGLFPGSRRREVDQHFGVMLEAAVRIKGQRPGVRFVAAAANDAMAEVMLRELGGSVLEDGACEIVTGRTHELMERVECAAIASGTATLEAAYFELPYCLVYRVAWPTWVAGKLLVKVDYLGIANLLAGREIVREFIQREMTAENIAGELLRLLGSDEAREGVCRELRAVTSKLGEKGSYGRAALEIVKAADEGGVK